MWFNYDPPCCFLYILFLPSGIFNNKVDVLQIVVAEASATSCCSLASLPTDLSAAFLCVSVILLSVREPFRTSWISARCLRFSGCLLLLSICCCFPESAAVIPSCYPAVSPDRICPLHGTDTVVVVTLPLLHFKAAKAIFCSLLVKIIFSGSLLHMYYPQTFSTFSLAYFCSEQYIC